MTGPTSSHFTESERLLGLIDISGLTSGDLATVALVHAVLDLSARLSVALHDLGGTIAETTGT